MTIRLNKFPYFKQRDQKDCGPTCLRMIAKYFGRDISIQRLQLLCNVNNNVGTSMLDISQAAEKIGFRTQGVKIIIEQLYQAQLPCILHWQQKHFVVLYKIKRGLFYIADPLRGTLVYKEPEFNKMWIDRKNESTGIALLINPSPGFYEITDEKKTSLNWRSVFKYLYVYRRLFVQLIIGLAIGSLFSLITPFLTQAVVDVGITTRNINLAFLILIAQLMLFIGSISVSFIRSWILFHISIRVNIAILTDFLIKIMKLPVSYFETKTTGDIMQRMNDQKNIETFLTSTTLNTIFSMINILIFTVILLYYNVLIFIISFTSTILATVWILSFLKRRRELNHKQFDYASLNQTNIVELVSGMKEIKLNNSERKKRWEWEHVQAGLFKFKAKNLALTQYQQAGSTFITQAKNLTITFLSIKAVIDGDLTLGGMMAIQFIVGQVGNPVEEILSFMQGYQDAKISLERLNEVHLLEDEEPPEKEWIQELPENRSINLSRVFFRYPGAGNDYALKDINLCIPEGKITAIIGKSGSGKTTVLKLLLRFFEPESGDIKIGGMRLDQIAFKTWRSKCGTVIQDGFIFADTIAANIAVGDESPNPEKLKKAIKIANISDLIESLPFGIETKIGSTGSGISQGQKQRLLIARSVYKNPEFLFFDEATNSLDANNERIIMQNLQEFFKDRTVIIVAHRLSTVKHADNIIVLDKGRIIEQGKHSKLIEQKGEYYSLIKDQLELEA